MATQCPICMEPSNGKDDFVLSCHCAGSIVHYQCLANFVSAQEAGAPFPNCCCCREQVADGDIVEFYRAMAHLGIRIVRQPKASDTADSNVSIISQAVNMHSTLQPSLPA